MLKVIIIVVLAVIVLLLAINLVVEKYKNKEKISILTEDNGKYKMLIKEYETTHKDLTKRLKDVKASLSQKEKYIDDLKNELEKLNKELSDVNSSLEENSKENSELKEALSSANEKVSSMEGELDNLIGKLSEKEIQYSNLEAELQNVQEMYVSVSSMLVEPNIKETNKEVLYGEIVKQHEQKVNGQKNAIKNLISEIENKEFICDYEKKYFRTNLIDITKNEAFFKKGNIFDEEIVYISITDELFELIEKNNAELTLYVSSIFNETEILKNTTLIRTTNRDYFENSNIDFEITDENTSTPDSNLAFGIYDSLGYWETMPKQTMFATVNITFDMKNVVNNYINMEEDENFKPVTECISSGIIRKHIKNVSISLKVKDK